MNLVVNKEPQKFTQSQTIKCLFNPFLMFIISFVKLKSFLEVREATPKNSASPESWEPITPEQRHRLYFP